jgi:hypothetical protein
MPDFIVVGIRALGQQLGRHQDESGGAEAALRCATFEEGLLHRREFAVGRKPFDGDYIRALRKRRKIKTAGHRLPIDQHRAATAQPLRAALARTEQLEPLLQDLDQILVRRNVGRDLLAIEREMDRAGHAGTKLGPQQSGLP